VPLRPPIIKGAIAERPPPPLVCHARSPTICPDLWASGHVHLRAVVGRVRSNRWRFRSAEVDPFRTCTDRASRHLPPRPPLRRAGRVSRQSLTGVCNGRFKTWDGPSERLNTWALWLVRRPGVCAAGAVASRL